MRGRAPRLLAVVEVLVPCEACVRPTGHERSGGTHARSRLTVPGRSTAGSPPELARFFRPLAHLASSRPSSVPDSWPHSPLPIASGTRTHCLAGTFILAGSA